MELLFLIPTIFAILLIALVITARKKAHNKQLKYRSLKTALFFCILSIIAVLFLAYQSGNKMQLLKLSLPVLISIIAITQIRHTKNLH